VKVTHIILSSLFCFSLSGFAQTAEEFVAKNLQARGGLDEIKAIQSLRMSGSFDASGFKAMVGTESKRPNLLRQTLATSFPSISKDSLSLYFTVHPQREDTPQEQDILPDRNPLVRECGSLPLSFEANEGQTTKDVKFLARGSGYTAFLMSEEFVISLRKSMKAREIRNFPFGARARRGNRSLTLESARSKNVTGRSDEDSTVLRLRLIGTNPHPRAVGVEKLSGTTNYFIGSDPRKWITGIPSYAKVRFEQVYRGVDLVYYGNQGQLEYDFVVAPGGDPRAIRMSIEGAENLTVNPDGELVLDTRKQQLLLRAPLSYQEINGSRRQIATRYHLEGKDRVSFQVSTFDAAKPLVIDPVLSFSSYLGGLEEDSANGVAADGVGNIYVTGTTQSLDFPVTAGVIQPNCAISGGCGNAFVTKINATTGAIQYSTYFGGHAANQSNAIAVDGAGNAYITGETGAVDFPVTPGAFQQNKPGNTDAFVAKLNIDGSALLYSTYLGGLFRNRGMGIAVDSSGSAYVTGVIAAVVTPGNTQPNFPITQNAAQVAFNGGLPCPLTGSCDDGFVTKFDPLGSALVYSTYLGGSAVDDALAIVVDDSGSAYVTGFTQSTDFPTTSQAFQSKCTLFPSGSGCSGDAFVTKLSADGSAFLYSTYLGGNFEDFGTGISVDAGGNAYVTGYTSSSTFPVTTGALLTVYPGTLQTAFVTKMNPSGSAPVYSTYLGGTTSGGGEQGHAIATDSAGHAYITGIGTTFDFPEVNPIQSSNSGNINVIVSELSSAGDALIFSTHLGGNFGIRQDSGQAIAVDNSGNIYVAGIANRVDFPTVNAFQSECAGGCVNAFGNLTSDAFVARISPANTGEASANPTTLLFPSTPAGGTSQSQPVVLRDVGSTPLAISAIQVTGDFAQSNTCGTALNGGGNCTISVSFKPTGVGTRTGTLTIEDNTPSSPHLIKLSGTSPGTPQVSLSSNSLSFGTVLEGTTSMVQSVTLANTGNGTLNIFSVSVVGADYTQTNTCGSSVAAGANCIINVSYSPTSSGANQTRIDVTDNAANSPQTIALSGTGTEFLLMPATGASTSQTVNAGATANYSLTLTPSATTRDTVTLSCSGAPPAAVCSVSPTQQTFRSSSAVSVSISVSTTSRSGLAMRGGFPTAPLLRYLALLTMMSSLSIAGILTVRATSGTCGPLVSRYAICFVFTLSFLLLIGCGGSSPQSTPPPPSGTPAGTYTLTVTAVSASSTNPNQTVTLNLTVN
jgi:hypothetical protein